VTYISASDFFEAVTGHHHRAIAIKGFCKLAAKPDIAFFQIDLVCHDPIFLSGSSRPHPHQREPAQGA
jgi:hypothetical protein